MEIARYSDHTIKSYISAAAQFFKEYPEALDAEVPLDKIEEFVSLKIKHDNISQAYQKHLIGAIGLFYKLVFEKNISLRHLLPKRTENKLPNVLSQLEVKAILDATENLKHKAILSTIYSGGLRIGELTNLRVHDIDSNRMVIRINQGKGKKDREVILSEKLLLLLRKYYMEYHPKSWLFEGQNGEHYSARSIQLVLKKSLQKAGIKKSASVHTLRHSFATHLLESGTDIRYIQEILGHNKLQTTEIYTHVTDQAKRKIKSPFDNL